MLNKVEGMANDHHRGGEIGHVVQPVVLFHEEGSEEQDGKTDPHHGAHAMAASLSGEVDSHHGKQQERVFQPVSWPWLSMGVFPDPSPKAKKLQQCCK
jgi:hypothetical protein